MTLGNRIKAARERLIPEVTQREIGEPFGITGQAVSQWERDQESPAIDKIAKLARLLRVPTDWLLEGDGPPPDPSSLESRIEQLTHEERAALLSVLDLIEKRQRSVA